MCKFNESNFYFTIESQPLERSESVLAYESLCKYKHEMYYVYKEISYMHPLLSSDLIGMGYIKLNFSLF